MLIDAGTNIPGLRKIAEGITSKPLTLIVTHVHPDHTGAAINDFPYLYMNAADMVGVPEFMPEYKGEKRFLKDGQVIDLGGRQLECIKFCGCHSPSSMVYLDTKYGCLFTGDEFEGGQVLIMGGGPGKSNNCIELYRDNLLDLKRRVDGRATIICPPHNGSAIDILLLDYMIENCERILAGHEGMKDVRSMTFGLNPHGYNIDGFVNDDIRRSEWMGTSIVYSKSRIFYRDVQ